MEEDGEAAELVYPLAKRTGKITQILVGFPCGSVPGADAQGKPVAIWVILPIRFAGG